MPVAPFASIYSRHGSSTLRTGTCWHLQALQPKMEVAWAGLIRVVLAGSRSLAILASFHLERTFLFVHCILGLVAGTDATSAMSWIYSLIFVYELARAVATRVPNIATPSDPWREVSETGSRNAQGLVELGLQRVVRKPVAKRQGGPNGHGHASIGLGDALDM